MRAKSDKVQLSFNAGEYSPFLDSRIDIDKAGSATRTMRNFLAEVGGTARRRPGLRFVAQIGGGEHLCDLTFITREGYGIWCGFPAFASFGGEVTKRYLTKTVRGEIKYYNQWPWGASYNFSGLFGNVRTWIESGNAPYADSEAIQTFWTGQAAYDPADGCSVASTLQQYRRTNGHYYPFLTSYGPGPAEQTLSIVDENDIFDTGGFTFYGTVQAYYSKITIEGENVRYFDTPGATFLGNQLGSHTYVGTIREVLGDSHSLFDQLVIDGAVITSTRQSELTSFNDGTGEYSGTVTAFQFARPLSVNQLDQQYFISFEIRVTIGSSVTETTYQVEYTGTGVDNEVITVPLPIFEGGVTEFLGECVSISEVSYYYDDFQRLPETNYTKGPVPSWPGWQEPGWFGCGTPSTISGEDWQDVAPPVIGQDIIFGDQETGDCWGDVGWFGGIAAIISDQDYEAETAGSAGPVEIRGVGWGNYGWYGGEVQPVATSDYEDETAGAATDETSGLGWGEVGWFLDELQPVSGHDFETEIAGAATTETGGTGWGYDGWFG